MVFELAQRAFICNIEVFHNLLKCEVPIFSNVSIMLFSKMRCKLIQINLCAYINCSEMHALNRVFDKDSKKCTHATF